VRLEEDCGAGYFTYLAGCYLDGKGHGSLTSVDIDPHHCATARKLCLPWAGYTEVIEADSVKFLKGRTEPIDVLYLDSMDCDTHTHGHQDHGLQEAIAGEALVTDGGLIVIDDTAFAAGWTGKGAKAVPYLLGKGWKLLGCGYQAVLQKPGNIVYDRPDPDAPIRDIVRQARPYTVVSEDRLYNLARLARHARNVDGIMAEFGVYRGGSAYTLASCCPGKQLRLFDTWAGIPEDDQITGGHKQGDFNDVIFDDVQTLLKDFDVKYYRGVFPQTAPDDDAVYALVHIDCDTYQSCKDALEYFLPRLSEGAVVIMDDYGWHMCPGVERAVRELCGGFQIHTGPQQCWFRV